MMDMQQLVNLISDAGRNERSRYHLTLGGLIKVLESAPPTAPVFDSTGAAVGGLRSYRGYYSDLAIGYLVQTAGELLADARQAVGREFQGYKGGEFLMSVDTPLWVAEYGDCGPAVVAGAIVDGAVILTTKELA